LRFAFDVGSARQTFHILASALMRTITLEEHFVTPAFLNGPGRSLLEHPFPPGHRLAGVVDRLRDIGNGRIAAMDAAGIDVQVLSLNSPGVEQSNADEAIAIGRDTNDFLADAIAAHPTRLAGFATVPTSAPDQAAAELERAVRQLGFKGLLINGHQQGRYLDDPRFESLLTSAESLDVPIYIHPTQPPAPVVETWYSGFRPELTYMFANAGWGWHIETAVHVLRMVLGGVLDRHPRLQIMIGHLGEGLPFMMSRVDVMDRQVTKLERPVSAYLRENVHYTISGFNFQTTFLDLLLEVGVNRILFSADYPYASMTDARGFLERLPVSPADREQIAHGNAERLLRM
jgi:predicted TIM-barrel fold metal-dependent hydrolase